MNLFNEIEGLLAEVRRPSWYMGREANSVTKDWERAKLKIALSYPDLYDMGMSNTGLKILYDIVNSRADLLAERVFAPLPDMEAKLREKGLPLFSLETRHPLNEFNLLGITLAHELTYSNILTILSLGGIPIRASERNNSHPIVIGGGTGAFNLSPVAEFFDAFFLGDGEEAILEIADLMIDFCHREPSPPPLSSPLEGEDKGEGGTGLLRVARNDMRNQLLEKLSKIEGIYVPVLPSPSPPSSPQRERKIRKRIVADINSAKFPEKPIVPYARIPHDRLTVEVQRGCTHGCRFCQAGFLYRPARQRSKEKIKDIISRQIKATGHSEISLLSLSIGDYGPLVPLMKDLFDDYGDKCVSVSIPSVRVEQLTSEVVSEIKRVRKTGFTIAPEAATDRLRNVINKQNTEEDLLKTAEVVFKLGWDLIKLYFMIGLPTETEEDVLAIPVLTEKVLQVGRRVNPRAKINLSVSTFVPKSHTPFQWAHQINMEETKRRQNLIRQNLRSRRIEFKWHSAEASLLEGVFSRGDERLSKVLIRAWELGCRLDAWDEHRRMDLWEKAFSPSPLPSPQGGEGGVRGGMCDLYLRERKKDEALPWDNLFSQLSKEFLWEEYNKATATEDCSRGACSSCGVCEGGIKNVTASSNNWSGSCRSSPPLMLVPPQAGLCVIGGPPVASPAPSTLLPHATRHPPTKYICAFSKQPPLHLLSHLEVVETIRRAVQRARIPIKFSEGFHPLPKIGFGQALGVGKSGEREPLTLELTDAVEPDEVIAKINNELPTGLRLVSCDIKKL